MGAALFMKYKQMFTTKLVLSSALLACSNGLMAETVIHGAVQNVAVLSASGSVEVQQDVLSISMSTTREGAEALTVQAQLTMALDAALVLARQAAMPGQLEVRTGNFSLYPRYGKDGKINGWQGSTELVLEGKDFARISGAANKIVTLTTANVSFALSRAQRARVEGEAQNQAIERFKTKAMEIAKGFGFSGYTLREVSIMANDQSPVPRPRMLSMARAETSDAPMSVEAGKSTVLVNVSGSVEMK